MRIGHAVTLISDDGAYGGPASVALEQAQALADRGHAVSLAFLWRGHEAGPTRFGRVRARWARCRRWMPGPGFSGAFGWAYPWRLRQAFAGADVVHVHVGRELAAVAALAVAAVGRRPVVAQTHGMVEPRSSAVARVFDLALKPLLGRAGAILVLTDKEESDLATVFGRRVPPLVRIPNGVRALPAKTAVDRPAGPPRVLFLARLHPRKRPEAFVEAAAMVRDTVPDAVFDVVGPDEGSLPAVRAAIAAHGLADAVRVVGPLSRDEGLARMRAADVYVLPSVDEPFPMSLLEALAAGTASVCTDRTGISTLLDERGAAIVTDGSPQALADAVIGVLTRPDDRTRLEEAGRRAVAEVFSVDAVAAALEDVYRGITQRRK